MKYPVTLTNVMRGVKKHKLADKLGDGVYKFLIELILEANELEFKNPIDLTVKQALAIGGGENRQTLYNRRKSLRKIMLDGKHLVKVTVGNYGSRSLAAYEIDYKLLMAQNGAWQGIEQPTSNEIDVSATDLRRSLDVTRYDPLPILRSDQKREDKITTTEAVAVLPSADEQNTETKSDRLRVMGAIQRRYSGQIGYNLPSEGKVRDLLELYAVDTIEEAIERLPLVLKPKDPKERITGDYVLGMVDKWAKNPSWGVPDEGGNGGAGLSMGERDRIREAKILERMKEELVELEAKTDGDWSEHILAMQVAIAEAEVG